MFQYLVGNSMSFLEDKTTGIHFPNNIMTLEEVDSVC